MIHKTLSPKPGCVRVTFELPSCVWADKIFLVGDFNQWSMTATPFVQGRDGVWRVALDLPAGKSYQFRYLVDGNWQTDYHADGWVANEFGSQNSIVTATVSLDETIYPKQKSLVREEENRTAFVRVSNRRAVLSPLDIKETSEAVPG